MSDNTRGGAAKMQVEDDEHDAMTLIEETVKACGKAAREGTRLLHPNVWALDYGAILAAARQRATASVGATCRCGHPATAHTDQRLDCWRRGCICPGFRDASVPERAP